MYATSFSIEAELEKRHCPTNSFANSFSNEDMEYFTSPHDNASVIIDKINVFDVKIDLSNSIS